MLYFVLFILILFLVIIITSFVSRFSLIKVEGDSMSPTFRNGQFLMVDRFVSPKYHVDFGDKIAKGSVIVYYSPSDTYVIKRLVDVIPLSSTEYLYWFEGDNKENSLDSREYGFINDEAILGEVINFSTFLKRTFTRKSGVLKEEKDYGRAENHSS